MELAWIDTSTGELYTLGTSTTSRSFVEDIARVAPSEIILPDYFREASFVSHPLSLAMADLEGNPRVSYPKTDRGTAAEGGKNAVVDSAIPLLSAYIRQTLLEHSPDLSHPLRVRPNTDMRIDRVSLKALEIKLNNDGGRSGTLLSVLDRTVTSAGMRLLSDRITAPSKVLPEIEARLSLVAWFKDNRFVRDEVVARLHQLDDEARLLQKMSIGRPTAEDLLAMAKAVRVQAEIKQVLKEALQISGSDASGSTEDKQTMKRYVDELVVHDHLATKIEAAVDIGALEAQRVRDFAADAAAANEAAESMSDDAEEVEEDTFDPWDASFGLPRSGNRKAKQAMRVTVKIQEARSAESSAKPGKVPLEPITWGRPEPTVMQPE